MFGSKKFDRKAVGDKIARARASREARFLSDKKEEARLVAAIEATELRRLEKSLAEVRQRMASGDDPEGRVVNGLEYELRQDAADEIAAARNEFTETRDEARKFCDPRDGGTKAELARFRAAQAALAALPDLEVFAGPLKPELDRLRATIPDADYNGRGERREKTIEAGGSVLIGS